MRFNLPFGSEVTTYSQTCLVQLLEFYCPNSMYNVRTSNNILSFCFVYVDEEGNLLPNIQSCSIPVGGYDFAVVNPLPTAINTVFNSNLSLNGISCVFNKSNALLSFDFTNWFTNNPNPAGQTLSSVSLLSSSTLATTVLGFDSNLCHVIHGTSMLGWSLAASDVQHRTGSITGTNLGNLKYPGDIVIKIDEINTNNRACGFSLGEVFHIVHCDVPFGGMLVTYPKIDFPYQIARFTTTHSSILTIRLTDIQNNELDLQGQDWTIVIGLKWAVDTGILGYEEAEQNEIPRPITFQTPQGFDPLDTVHSKKRGRH